MWPSNLLAKFEDGYGLLAFITAVVVWLVAELATSETSKKVEVSPNDVRRARDIIRLHSHELRVVLNDNITWNFLNDEYYQLCGRLISKKQTGEFVFLDPNVQPRFELFIKKLDKFHFYIGEHASPETIGGQWRTGFKPFRIVSQEEYDLRRERSDVADTKANEVWAELEKLVSTIKNEIPMAYDSPIEELDWFKIGNN